MKKIYSILLALILILSMLPCVPALAAETTTEVLQYVAQDFENGWDASSGNVSAKTTVTWTSQNTHGGSAGAVEFSTTQTYGAVSFPLRTVAGNTYEMSVWIKVKEAPLSQKAYFIVYNPSTDGETAQAWNQITATTSGNFEVGKWVLCTATFTANGKGKRVASGGGSEYTDVLPDGTVEFRLGDGVPANVMASGTVSYAMDDFFVVPEVDHKLDESDMITYGGFDTAVEFSVGWGRTGKNTTIAWEANDGANGTLGAAKVTVPGSADAINTDDPVKVQFGRDYKLTFWAKAGNDAAVGQQIYGVVIYNRKNAQDPTSHKSLYPTGTNTVLSNNWQKYEIDFSVESIAEEYSYPNLEFRVKGAGLGDRIFMLDEVSMHQTGSANFDIEAQLFGTAQNKESVLLQMAYTERFVGTYLYRIIKETGSGDEVVKVAQTKGTQLWLSTDDVDANTRIEVVGVDCYGNCSRLKTVYGTEDPALTDTVTLRPDQYLWNNDTKTLSATVTYQNETADKQILSIAAQYAQDGSLISATPLPVPVSAYQDESWQVSIKADPTAVKAKFFAWYDGSMAPATYRCEIEKTTKGEFIYVDANSKASAEEGSFDAPFKSLLAAQSHLEERLTTSDETDFYVVLKPGEYVNANYQTLELDADSYATGKNVVYTSLSADRAKISGAMHLAGEDFDYDAENGYYYISVPDGTETRQLYVNGIKATRARSPEDAIPFVNLDSDEAEDLAVNGSNAIFDNEGLTTTETSFLDYQYPTELEVYFTENWRHQFLMVDSMDETEDGLVHFGFTHSKQRTVWYELVMSNTPATVPVYVENALELLDEEGEWYLDTYKDILYYKPRYFESMSTADFVIPGQEKLVTIKGTPENPVSNISFKNIDFEYTTWNYPTENRAFANGQNASFENPNGGALMEGAVELYDVKNIDFDNCDFSKIGSMALKMTGAIQNCDVTGNEFYDVAGSALALGDLPINYGKPNIGDNCPEREKQIVHPTDPMYYITDNLIANNYIHKVGTEYLAAAALSTSFPKNTTIRNNEITDSAYCGIHTGWGWARFADSEPTATEGLVIEKNYIHDVFNWRLFDGGSIYMLGATNGTAANPNILRGNYLKDQQNYPGAIYPDEGSTNWTITENVIDQKKYPYFYKKENDLLLTLWMHIWTSTIQNITIHDNYSTTLACRNDGTRISYEEPACYPEANWPKAALAIIEAAGIEKAYRNRFDFDIQKVETPRKYEVSIGETVPYISTLVSSKDQLCDASDVEIRAKSSNSAIATVDAADGTITGVSAGKAWITLSVCREENGEVTYYDEHTFYVVVE